MKRSIFALIALFVSAAIQTSCDFGGNAPLPGDATMTPTNPSGSVPTEPPTPGSYPTFGQAPDLSWISGRVTFTKIQGSCVYIFAKEVPAPAAAEPTSTGPVVGTSVAND
ncbi:MAG TPA: hypothetical protein VFH60_11630, partial [Chloroflexia bacterium]|nr:hypothetical protein [Chloroflexia bacterium]